MSFRNASLIGFLLFLASTPAWASARDDVMSGSARCAIIENNRDWLNCYYGAAQPMRASLGLPSATPAQINLVPPHSAMTTAPPAQPGARDAVMSGSARCAAIEDNHTWLDCYYGAAQPMRAELSLPPALPSQTVLASAPARVQTQAAPPLVPRKSGNFFDDTILGGQRMTQKLSFVTYKMDKYGIFTAKLSNGQTWRQVDGDNSFAHWTKPAASYKATIYSGALGSYNMRIDGDSNIYKVRPVYE